MSSTPAHTTARRTVDININGWHGLCKLSAHSECNPQGAPLSGHSGTVGEHTAKAGIGVRPDADPFTTKICCFCFCGTCGVGQGCAAFTTRRSPSHAPGSDTRERVGGVAHRAGLCGQTRRDAPSSARGPCRLLCRGSRRAGRRVAPAARRAAPRRRAGARGNSMHLATVPERRSRARCRVVGRRPCRCGLRESFLGRISGPLSSCRILQAALKFSYHSDRVTRYWPVALRVRAAKSGARILLWTGPRWSRPASRAVLVHAQRRGRRRRGPR